MTLVQKMGQNLAFLRELWRNKAAVRALLASGNYPMVRDFAPGHFYSPIPDLKEVRANAQSVFDRSARELPAISINEKRQLELLKVFSKIYSQIPFPSKQTPPYRYFFDNPYFSYGDGVILYSFLRSFKPNHVVEIGSGYSSAEMLDVNDLFFDKRIKFTFIEPYPERLFSLLSAEDKRNCTIETKALQQIDLSVFSALEENDILFVDSSHVAKTGSDVLRLIFDIFPRLKKGVIIHFHDILWPFQYPQNWVEEGRAWNEAYFLRAFLQYNPAFEILYFNSFMATHQTNAMKGNLPMALKVPSNPETFGNSSVWLRKKT